MAEESQDISGRAGGGAGSLLRRKAEAGRAEQQARAMSLQKALRVTLAKVAEDSFDLAMAALAVRVETRASDALDELFDGNDLLMLLDGPAGQRGAVVFDGLLVGALIQQQTMGRVLGDPGREARALTSTDAAICVPFLDALLTRAAPLPDAEEDRRWLEGYRFGARAEDPRLVLMALEAPEHRVVHLTVDIAGGTRQGRIMLCLPIPEVHAAASEEAAGEVGTAGPPPKQLMSNVLALKADLNIALARLKLPLRDLGALKAGDLLPLPGSSFEEVKVITMDGRAVAQGALGQVSGQRAVKLTRRPAPLTQPRRRASDRAELNLPEVQFDRRANDAPEPSAPPSTQPEVAKIDNPPPVSQEPPELPDLPDLPDMSDLPGFGDGEALPELPDLPEREVG